MAMRRIVLRVMVLAAGLAACGCGSPGWFRSVGHFPGVAPSDYAFYDFCGVSSQVFPFSPIQVQSAAVEALRDLDFREFQPPSRCPDGGVEMRVRTPDGRQALVTFTPQNTMTNVRFSVGPLHIGDEMLAHDLFRRVALNFGTLPRTYLPIEPVLSRRIHPPKEMPLQVPGPPPEVLEGEGLRPGEEGTQPGLEYTAPVTGAGSGVVPQPFDPLRPYGSGFVYPNYPYDPFASPYFAPPIPMQPATP
jgi:hypothetical protein